MAFPVASVAVALVIYTHRKKLFPNLLLDKQVWLIAILMIFPTLVYYLSRGERASEYFTSWTLALSHLLLQPTFYLRWLNLVQKLVSWLALVATAVSLLVAHSRERVMLIALWVGIWSLWIIPALPDVHPFLLPFDAGSHRSLIDRSHQSRRAGTVCLQRKQNPTGYLAGGSHRLAGDQYADCLTASHQPGLPQ